MIGHATNLGTGVNKIVFLIPSESIVLKIENIPALGITHH